MNEIYFVMRSVTAGQRGSALLEKAGVRARLTRSPGRISPNGCAYAIRIGPRDLERAEEILLRSNLPYTGVYRALGGESYEKVRP